MHNIVEIYLVAPCSDKDTISMIRTGLLEYLDSPMFLGALAARANFFEKVACHFAWD